jgi:hypothetical protein
MSTDLTTVRDHPAAILANEAKDPAGSVHLLMYEVDHKVTFAALDNDALDAVRTAYAADDNTELAGAICDLLGLA